MLTGYKIRAQLQVGNADFARPFVTTGGGTPSIPAGVDLRCEFLCKDGTSVVDVSNFATATMTVMAATRTGAPYMSASTGSFDNTATQETYNDGTQQHFAFDFTAAETDLVATTAGTEYYLVVQAKDGDDVVLFEAWTRFKVILDGLPEDQLVVQPGNIVPVDAEYDGSGEYDLSALTTDGVFYKWTDGGANDTNVDNGGDVITTSGTNFIAASSVVLNGTPSALVTAVVRKSPYLTADEVQAAIDNALSGAGGQTFGGTAAPEGAVSAPQWAHYQQVDGSNDLVRLWVRVVGSGTLNTGWR